MAHKSEDAELKKAVEILLVDDHPVIRRGLKALLESSADFIVCYEASDGEQAIRLAARSHPDVIVMDITMPGVNGLDATRVIHQSAPDIPIIVMSMHTDPSFVMAAKDFGAQGYVSKSDAGDRLIDAVSAVLNHQQFFPKANSQPH